VGVGEKGEGGEGGENARSRDIRGRDDDIACSRAAEGGRKRGGGGGGGGKHARRGAAAWMALWMPNRPWFSRKRRERREQLKPLSLKKPVRGDKRGGGGKGKSIPAVAHQQPVSLFISTLTDHSSEETLKREGGRACFFFAGGSGKKGRRDVLCDLGQMQSGCGEGGGGGKKMRGNIDSRY